MKNFKLAFAMLLIACSVFATSGTYASTYNYSSVITLCTGTCASFASLDLGSTITGTVEINTTPGGSFTDADILSATFYMFNPSLPPSGPVGDPVNDNPLVLDSGLGIIASNGTSGTTDSSDEINSGQMLFQFLIAPFSTNDTFIVFDLGTGNGQICLFFSTAGCIPGATEAVKFEGQFTKIPIPAAVWLLASGLLVLGGLRRRT